MPLARKSGKSHPVRALRHARILICDDRRENLLALELVLQSAGYQNVTGTTDGEMLIQLCAQSPPDLVLLDLQMPYPDGFEVMRRLEAVLDEARLPILVLSADATPQAKKRALSAGARDFVTKPFDRDEVLLRIENLLETRFLSVQLREQHEDLERTVHERTQQLEDAGLEILERLALATEYRDDDTGSHAQRVGTTAALLYQALGRPRAEVKLLRHAATLHDVGKIGIPDRILLKPGPLTPVEYEAMKSHVEVSRRFLSGSRTPLLRLSEEIALSHHERWDGSGYPSGLRREQIPLSGRAVAVADVFDTLTHERSYKPGWSVEEAIAEIRAQSGRQFDPRLVELFLTLDHYRLVDAVEAADGLSFAPVPARDGC